MKRYPLSSAEAPIREALQRLAESPRELRCFVVINEPLTRRFVQFCTPPPPSPFAGSSRIQSDEPLIFDGTGKTRPEDYEQFNEPCDVKRGTALALDVLERYLPPEAELVITEESTQEERPS